MDSNWWASTVVTFSSGSSYTVHTACETPNLPQEASLACVPFLVSVVLSPTRRRLSTTRRFLSAPSPPPFSTFVSLTVPPALSSKLIPLGSFIALRNTDGTLYGTTGTPACAVGSSSSDYFNSSGTLNTTLCAPGTYSLQLISHLTSPSDASSFSLKQLTGIVVGGVVACVAVVSVLKFCFTRVIRPQKSLVSVVREVLFRVHD